MVRTVKVWGIFPAMVFQNLHVSGSIFHGELKTNGRKGLLFWMNMALILIQNIGNAKKQVFTLATQVQQLEK